MIITCLYTEFHSVLCFLFFNFIVYFISSFHVQLFALFNDFEKIINGSDWQYNDIIFNFQCKHRKSREKHRLPQSTRDIIKTYSKTNVDGMIRNRTPNNLHLDIFFGYTGDCLYSHGARKKVEIEMNS